MVTKKVGRPAIHQTPEQKKAANAEAAKKYRAEKKKLKQNNDDKITSKIIDLSAVAAWRRR